MIPRICRKTYQQFLASFYSTDLTVRDQLETHIGRVFLAIHFPGIEDPDVSEESDHHRCLQHIEERYVQPLYT